MPENQNIEWKQTWRDEYLKWICGFANAQGGRIYIGLNDDGEVSGLNNYAQLMEDIPNKIVAILGIMPEVNLLEREGSFYIEINVAPSSVPVNYKGEYHYRCGSTRQQLKGAALNDFLARKTGLRWDAATISTITVDDLDKTSFNTFRRAARGSGRLSESDLAASPKELLERLHLLDNGRLTRAAALLFYHEPEKIQFGCYVKIGRFTKGSELLYQDEMRGSLIELADKVVDFLFLKYFKATISYNKERRIERYPYPRPAVREVVYNALVHCNWSDCIPVQIRVNDDSLMISNSCVLPWGWSVSELVGIHSSRPYNPLIANTFFRAGFIEAWGRGINTVFDYCRENHYPEPVYKVNGADVNVIFPIDLSYEEPDNKESITISSQQKPYLNTTGNILQPELETKIIQLIEKNPTIRQADLAAELHVGRSTIQRCIKHLVESNRLIRRGSKNHGWWKLLHGIDKEP